MALSKLIKNAVIKNGVIKTMLAIGVIAALCLVVIGWIGPQRVFGPRCSARYIMGSGGWVDCGQGP